MCIAWAESAFEDERYADGAESSLGVCVLGKLLCVVLLKSREECWVDTAYRMKVQFLNLSLGGTRIANCLWVPIWYCRKFDDVLCVICISTICVTN